MVTLKVSYSGHGRSLSLHQANQTWIGHSTTSLSSTHLADKNLMRKVKCILTDAFSYVLFCTYFFCNPKVAVFVYWVNVIVVFMSQYLSLLLRCLDMHLTNHKSMENTSLLQFLKHLNVKKIKKALEMYLGCWLKWFRILWISHWQASIAF